MSKPVLGLTQSPIQWVAGAFSLGVKCPGMKLITHLHLVLRSKMCRAISPIPPYVFMVWCSVKAQGQLYLLPFYLCKDLSSFMSESNETVIVLHENIWNTFKNPGDKLIPTAHFTDSFELRNICFSRKT